MEDRELFKKYAEKFDKNEMTEEEHQEIMDIVDEEIQHLENVLAEMQKD